MKSPQITTSAALYFRREPRQPVPLRWLEKAQMLFADHNLSPILFTASGGKFLLDDCYVLAGPGGDLVMWGEPVSARGEELTEELRAGIIDGLGLDSPRRDAGSRSNWRAMVSVFSAPGRCYFGFDEELINSALNVVEIALGVTSDLFDIYYGIAYTMPLEDYPEGYAGGYVNQRFEKVSDIFNGFRAKRETSYQKTPDELWRDELYGEQKHLTGLFRGAYPASILSESHVQNADLMHCGIGSLSQLNSSTWLWELSASEIPVAEKMLEDRGVLVRQLGQP